MITKAREFACKYHGEQKYGEYPYVVHLDAVAEIVQQYGETAVVIAYLHDVVEDTEISFRDVKKEFGSFVADCVAVLTDESGKDRKERKEKTYSKMALICGKTEIALLVKAADRLANMRACLANKKERLLKIYKAEYPVFKEAVCRPGRCEEIWAELAELNTVQSLHASDAGMQGQVG
ncbi:MAG: bifunctional (p)ppGpp synthetase/guanosine-3',5'-bis(diphosphate) 3'-pyrophosphohydrolase [Candidatus Electrothrix sp. AX5]|jgi:(p)ppGpp synthase/HD superfamily hydrolase|nr:bifunctional (p)ppGpp synthetase/guanosine-3',5'-bis(diphosphate) 3'-pyrophosphohydrolase [Candidatus Electrothrix sp. AX5]